MSKSQRNRIVKQLSHIWHLQLRNKIFYFLHIFSLIHSDVKQNICIAFHLCHVAVFTNNQIYFIKTVQCNLLYYLI
jgi:hypothetical protein